MLTLNHLIETRPDLRLGWTHPAHARTYGETRVAEVTAVVPVGRTGQDIGSHHLPGSGGLALMAWDRPRGERATEALCALLAQLRLHNAAGLVLRTPGHRGAMSPRVRAEADGLGIPVLTTGADSEWVGVNHFIQRQRALVAERHAERLESLLHQIPVRLGNARTREDIVTWLSTALDADVAVGSNERGVLTAAPDDRANLARRVVAPAEAGDAASAAHTRAVRILGGSDTLVLGVASHRPFDGTDVRLTRHAAKFLGICEQGRHDRQATVVGPRQVSQAVTQLLLGAEPARARTVARTIAPSLMDTGETVVRIIDTGGHGREATLRWCEHRLSGRALVSPCPQRAGQIIVVTPARHDASVGSELSALVGERGWLVMGVSRSRGMDAGGAAYAEAAQALRNAARAPGRISTGVQPKLAPLLPRPPAHAWAAHLLGPVLRPAHRQLLATVRVGCSFKPGEASRGLGIHRNTLRQRMARANRVLGLDLTTVNDRILVLLALDILSLPAPSPASSGPVPDLKGLLTQEAEAVRSWAENRLSPLRSGRRDLGRTLCVWLEHDLSVRRTARALGVSEATVRHRTNDLGALLGLGTGRSTADVRDTRLVTLADVGVAAHVLLGRPRLREPRTGSDRPPVVLPFPVGREDDRFPVGQGDDRELDATVDTARSGRTTL